MPQPKREATLLEAFIPIIFLIVLLFINVSIFGDSALDGSNQVVLILAALVASIMAAKLGYEWHEISDGIVKSISSAMSGILILLLIGSLAGSWMISGIVPAMIYYGLQIINPSCLVCSIVSLATGSSWTTSATIGIALIGIGRALDINEGMVAGAVLSGAYFGDKMSPLSDTTNLAPSMAGTDLFTHIRYMTYTTVPSITITLIIFLILGFSSSSEGDMDSTAGILTAINSAFYISGWLFLVPIFMVVEIVSGYSGAYWKVMFVGSMKALYGSIAIVTDNEMVNELLSSGGMAGMLKTIWLIIAAMTFGGVMEVSGMLKTIAQSVLKLVKSTGSLIASTAGTCIFFNITASDQYLSIVVPGRMYADIYKEKNLAPENLSRTLEDSGTVTSVLVPWNTCGAFHGTVLAINPLDFIPYCFFNLISPIMTMTYGYLNIKIKKLVEGGNES